MQTFARALVGGANPQPSTIIKMKEKTKKSSRSQYYNTLTRVGKIVDKTIDKYLSKDKFGEYKRIIYEPLLKKKQGKQKLRAALTYLSYCTLTGIKPSSKINEDLAKLATSTEFEIWSEYMANWIFDNKAQVSDPLIRKKTAVATKSFLEDAIRIAGEVGEKYPKIILNTSSNVTKGFVQEFILNFSNDKLLNSSFRKYFKLYSFDYGNPGIGETFSQSIDLAALYANKEKTPEANELRNIFLEYGIYQEVLNDLGDFATRKMTTDKVASDQFSDIRNGALTPIIWCMYNKTNNKNKKFMKDCVGKIKLTEKEKFKLIKILFKTGTYDFISKKIKRTGRKLKKRIKNLEFNNEGSSQLQQLVSILESNKIYHILKENYEESKKRDVTFK